jgi:hypothetical protein
MERLTILSENKRFYVTDHIKGKLADDGYYGDAIQKLAKFENLYDYLIARQNSIPKELEILRNEGKIKTVTFRELLSRKMMNAALLTMMEEQCQ